MSGDLIDLLLNSHSSLEKVSPSQFDGFSKGSHYTNVASSIVMML